MLDYSKGKIYKIVCNVTGKVYYGSTVEPTVAKRLSKHVASFKRFKQGKITNCTSFEILEENDYCIILVEEYSCETKDQLLRRERFFIDNNDCVNKFRPIVSKEEKKIESLQYYQEHKEDKKNYYQINKDKRLKYQQKYDNIHKDRRKERRKQYNQKLNKLEVVKN